MQVDLLNAENQPAPRSGHAFLQLSARKYILIGGASHEQGLHSDMHLLDLVSMKWELLKPNFPSRFEFASACFDEKLMVFGGCNDKGLLNDGLIVDINDLEWKQLIFKGVVPSARTSTQVCVVDTKRPSVFRGSGGLVGSSDDILARMYLFSGGSVGNEAVDDASMYCLNLESLLWVKLTDFDDGERHPKSRLGHSLIRISFNELLMFGGMNGETFYNDCWIYNMKTNRWTELNFEDCPSPRSGHSMIAIDTQRALLVGGLTFDGQPKVSNEVWEYETETQSWIRIELPGAVARLNQTLIQPHLPETDHYSVISFGGIDLDGLYSDLHSIVLMNVPNEELG